MERTKNGSPTMYILQSCVYYVCLWVCNDYERVLMYARM